MKKFLSYLFSMQMMGVLILFFAFAIAAATFIENDFGTQAARNMVYNAKWFELLLFLIGINLIANIFRYRLFSRKKWTILIFHTSFIIILLGAAITRYAGYEAVMHIRETENSNKIVSTDSYIDIVIRHGDIEAQKSEKINFASLNYSGFETDIKTNQQYINIELLDYIPHAELSLQEDTEGQPIIEFIVVGKQGMHGMQTYTLKHNESRTINNQLFTFAETDNLNAITFCYSDSLQIRAPYPIDEIKIMGGSKIKTMKSGVFRMIEQKKLYELNGTKILVKKFYPKAKLKYVEGKDKNNLDVMIFNVSNGLKQNELIVTGKKGDVGAKYSANIGYTQVDISFGSKILNLPFSIKLNDFQLDRYPGSNSPSSYASEVTLFDTENNHEENHRIFMNNILKYQGFRFYQSSYDKDEKGTILSVNRDSWGMMTTYIGYFVMIFGMAFSLFNKSSRFKNLSLKTNDIGKGKITKTLALFLFLSCLSLGVSAQTITDSDVVSKEQASKFGKLLIQDNNGRIKPINTYASQIIRKISRKDKFMGYHPDRIFLSMLCNPVKWETIPIIKISDSKLAKDIDVKGDYAAFKDFITPHGQYKLEQLVEQASAKKPIQRTSYDKELIKVDERVNISYMMFIGDFLKIFPNPNNGKWHKPTDEINLQQEDSLLVKKSLQIYFEAINDKDYDIANIFLLGIKIYQEKNGGEILPSEMMQKTEIFYNNTNIFKRLFPIYLIIGFLLLILLIINIVQPKFNISWIIRIATILLGIGFILHTFGLGVRWYISGHAPWSNGFESMIYVAWASLLSGFMFIRKSYFALAATAVIAGLTLFVAHLSWMNPEITNLVPVLKSYWLTIHVAIITASYGFLALGALLGFINLVLMIMKNTHNQNRIDSNISDLTTISEMTLIIGLYFLTIGSILGGIWANESWGRYWGWDPKETWALVTILIYSFVVHLRFIPGLRSIFTFNLLSLLSYGSVLMTYFGVNYYLAGLHSYAQGDPVPVPTWIYYVIMLIAVVSLSAYYKYKVMESDVAEEKLKK